MGEVFRALDKASGDVVALKVLRDGRAPEEARFDREALALLGLRHPGIVRYVAHGMTGEGKPYLAMEWLEGEDLSTRLTRQRLTVNESVALIGRVAEALALAHGRGVVHRDLKPSNLYLLHGDVEQVKILDFGLAKLGGMSRVTLTGMTLGTPGYMAPEQARTGQEIDPRADVFSLGCVLFECLTGAPAFKGDHYMAILAKILFEEAPRVSELCPTVPLALDRLCARMLAKDPEDRPRDGGAVAAALVALGAMDDEMETRPLTTPPTALTGGEQRLLSVVMMGRDHHLGEVVPVPPPPQTRRQETALREELRRTAERSAGRIELLADGSVAVTITGTRIATDQAAQAARCAIALREYSSGRPIVLVTGRGQVTGRMPVGAAIDLAAKMLSRRMLPTLLTSEPGRPAPIAIDQVTAGLLDDRFDIRHGPNGPLLFDERQLAEDTGTRTLLGKSTPCVGRDRELATIEAMFAECADEHVPQAMLVTAPAGIGKSRIAHEVIRSVRRRGDPVEIWMGRSDSLRAGSAFVLLGQALRGACGIRDGEPIEARREKLRARVARHVPPAEQQRVTEFLGELTGTTMPDDDSPPLRAARQDALLMGDQMRRAWEDLLAAECSVQPVLLVLEDLHWGDLPTVRFIDSALHRMKEKPFMVLALARPEVHELFPKLWADRGVQEIRLKELTKKAAERLVRQVLGTSVNSATIERLVAQADGHAFFLEELIRAVADGRGEALPETVLAMVQARLEGLEADARRVLRAASVFGEVFWQGGVAALLGGALRSTQTDDWLSILVEREVIVRRPETRFPGDLEFAFRHALLREGAYAMLTEEDRALGHRLAAEWLEQRGEINPMVLAEHFERGKEPARAGAFYLRAAELANRGSDTDAAMARARRGLECGVEDDVRIGLLATICESHAWRSEWNEVAPYAEEIIALAKPGTAPWAMACAVKLLSALTQRRHADFMDALTMLRTADPYPEAMGVFAHSLGTGVFALDLAGQVEPAELCVQRLREVVERSTKTNLIAAGWFNMLTGYRQAWVKEDPWTGLVCSELSMTSFTEANHKRGALMAQVFLGMNFWYLGQYERAERNLVETKVAEQDLAFVSSIRTLYLVEVLADRGEFAEAREEALRTVELWQSRGLAGDEGRMRLALAGVLYRTGEYKGAEREARTAFEQLSVLPLDQPAAAATLAAALLAQGRAAEALTTARRAVHMFEERKAFGFKGTFASLIFAEALRASGAHEEAREAIAVARDRLLGMAARVENQEFRRTFLENVAEHARTLQLAKEWLGEAPKVP